MFGAIYRLILIPGIITVGYFYGYLLFQQPAPASVDPNIPQTELDSISLLLNSTGSTNEVGFMRAPLKLFNEESLLPWQKLRLKKWDHFDVITENTIFTISVVDVLFLGEIRVDYFDFRTREKKSLTKYIFPTNIPYLSPTSYRFTADSVKDNINYKTDDLTLTIENVGTLENPKANTRRIIFESKELNMKAEIKLSAGLKQEAMVAVIPLTPELQHFFYTVKMPNIGAEGSIKIDQREEKIINEKSGGFIDWARGVWTYNSYWVFARAQGVIEDKKKFSLVLASGYGDNTTSTANEDSFFIDEKMYKLNTIYPEFDDFNLMNPWTLKTKGESKNGARESEIVFVPHYISEKDFNIYLLKSNMRVVFGELNGWVSDDNGKKYNFQKLHTMIEVHKAKW